MPPKKSRKLVKPAISIIGAGRLGTALALGLIDRGYRVLTLVGRTAPSNASAWLPASTLTLRADQLNQLPLTELILISTPDDVIKSVALELSISGRVKKGATVLHTSGALSSRVLRPLADAGLHTGSIHPLVSVINPEQGVRNLVGANFCIEGDATALKVARGLVRDFAGKSFSIPADKKSLYHAAAVMSAGHVVSLFDLASEMLSNCGLSRAEAQRVLFPLLRSTVANLEDTNPAGALTGPFARGDVETAAEHVKALKRAHITDAKSVYRLLGQHSLRLASTQRMKPSVRKELRRALGQLKD